MARRARRARRASRPRAGGLAGCSSALKQISTSTAGASGSASGGTIKIGFVKEALSSYGAWYLVIVGGLAVAATPIAPRGLWGFAADRFGWSLLPVGYRVRHPRG